MNPIVLWCGISVGLFSTALLAGPENVNWPGDYKNEFKEYFNGDRTANEKQIIRIFANPVAVAGKNADGKLPNGSVMVGELYSVKLDGSDKVVVSSLGRRIADKLTAVVVMERGAGFDAQYPDALKVGDWEFAVFSPVGQRLDKDVTGCRTCHHPLGQSEFLFSYEHLN